MDSDVLSRSFEKIGARVQIVPTNPPIRPRLLACGNRPPARGFSVEVKNDSRGRFFEIRTTRGIKFTTTEGPPNSESLLLFVKTKKGVYPFSCGNHNGAYCVHEFPELNCKIKLVK